MTESDNPKKEWVKLNIGGKCFLTTRMTLCKDPESFLSQCIDSSYRDADGAIQIDRDPTYFGPVLNYLRHGNLVINKNLTEEGVLEEAEFYNIANLVAMLKERIAGRDHMENKQNYRVLQCHDNELTQMVSTLTEGWNLEQVINMGFACKCSNQPEEQAKFLCVVSKAGPSLGKELMETKKELSIATHENADLKKELLKVTEEKLVIENKYSNLDKKFFAVKQLFEESQKYDNSITKEEVNLQKRPNNMCLHDEENPKYARAESLNDPPQLTSFATPKKELSPRHFLIGKRSTKVTTCEKIHEGDGAFVADSLDINNCESQNLLKPIETQVVEETQECMESPNLLKEPYENYHNIDKSGSFSPIIKGKSVKTKLKYEDYFK